MKSYHLFFIAAVMIISCGEEPTSHLQPTSPQNLSMSGTVNYQNDGFVRFNTSNVWYVVSGTEASHEDRQIDYSDGFQNSLNGTFRVYYNDSGEEVGWGADPVLNNAISTISEGAYGADGMPIVVPPPSNEPRVLTCRERIQAHYCCCMNSSGLLCGLQRSIDNLRQNRSGDECIYAESDFWGCYDKDTKASDLCEDDDF
jgi:hypothetical protein